MAEPLGERPPTIRDVAARAEVSTSMAARILSGRRARHDDKEAAVLRAARELDYRPNLVARSLRAEATRMVAMIVPAVTNPFFPQLIEAVTRRAGEQGTTLLLADACEDPELELRHVHALVDRRVDGLIIAPVDGEASAAAVAHAAARVRTVQVDRHVTGATSHVLTSDNEAGMRDVVAHVCDLGASDLVLISGDARSSTGIERRRAFHDAVAAAGLTARADVLGEFSLETGRAAAEAFVADGQLPEAVVCGADVIAFGFLERCRDLGITEERLPVVTGFDDVDLAVLSVPSLTTVRQPTDELAVVAMELLARSATPVQHVRLRPELVVRGSSGGGRGGATTPQL